MQERKLLFIGQITATAPALLKAPTFCALHKALRSYAISAQHTMYYVGKEHEQDRKP
jgi:hypothetical protein